MVFFKIRILTLFFLLSLLSCGKMYVCQVDTHKEGYGISGIPPNFSPFLSWVSDTTEFVNVLSKEKDLPSIELRLSESRIDSTLSNLGENLYKRTIILKKAKCNI